jgi:hypothetical protein
MPRERARERRLGLVTQIVCVYCVYIAANADLVREHAKRGGFPADVVARVRAVIDPTTSG